MAKIESFPVYHDQTIIFKFLKKQLFLTSHELFGPLILKLTLKIIYTYFLLS